MTYKENIKAILECYFAGFKDEIIDSACVRILSEEPMIGHWIDADDEAAICSCCNRLNYRYGDYCKHCGAKMIKPKFIAKADGTIEQIKE